MDQHQLATLALMQVFIPSFVWVIGAATWTTLASSRQYADVTRTHLNGEVLAQGRFWFAVGWIGLNAALLPLKGGF